MTAAALCIAAVAALAATAAFAADEVTLVQDGHARAEIVVAPYLPPQVRFGARDLQRHIELMSGAELPIVATRHTGVTAIVLAVSRELHEEQYHIMASGDTVGILGGGERGTLYGIYGLLQDVLGCRWFTDKVSHIPHSPTIRVPGLDITREPAFEYREPYFRETMDSRDWAVRNRCNGNFMNLPEAVGGKVTYGRFVHTFAELVPPEKYFATHPEYFSLVNGVRQNGYAQLCLTNPDVLKIVIAKVQEWIRENPHATIFSVSQNDTYKYCECDNCQAIAKAEGAQSGVLLHFVNQVADAIAKDHPNVLIDTLAYQWSEDPPKHERPRPNVRIRLAPLGACFAHPVDGCTKNAHVNDNLNAWADITHQLYMWHYCTDFANYLQPLPDLDEIAGDIPLFHRKGVVGIFYEGAYAKGGGGEMAWLKSYLEARLMWDPDQPAEPIIAEFLDGVYGPAAPYIRQWLDLIHEGERAHAMHASVYDGPTAEYLGGQVLMEGERLFDRAEAAAAADHAVLERVRQARLSLEYVQVMREMPAVLSKDGRVIGQPSADLKRRARFVADRIRRDHITEYREGQPVGGLLKELDAIGAD